jgi:CRP/FNR family transcriptional regulator
MYYPLVPDPHASSPLQVLWRQNPIFAAVPESDLLELIAACPDESFAPRQLILGAGELAAQLFVVLSGTVRIFHRSSDGREVVVKLLRAPSVFAEIELFHGIAMLESVDTVDPVRLARVPGERYIALLHRHPAAMFAHLKHLAAAFAVAARNEQQVFALLEQRIANLLLSYADLESAPAGPVELPVPLSQNDIAQSLGAVRRSVTRILSAWQKAGTLGVTEGRWVLRDVQRLEELAAPIRHSLNYQMGMSLEPLAQRAELSSATLTVTRGHTSWIDRCYPVDEELIIGRQAPARLLLPSDTISPQHCRVFRAATGGRFWVEDLESLNGTTVNGKPVKLGVLREGDAIGVGGFELKFGLRK